MKNLAILLILLNLSVSAGAQVIAVVGNNKITLQYFKKQYERVRRENINPPDPQTFLEDLIRLEIGVQEAEKRKLREHPAVKEAFRKELYKALVEKAIGKQVQKIRVKEREMRAFYRKNPELRTSHILIEFKPNSSAKEIEVARKRATEIYSEVKKSKRPFADLVRLYSDDSLSKNSGGDIGYQSRVTLVPTYYDTAKSMKVGQVRGLVRTRFGFHIVKLTGKRAYSQANKRQIRTAVFDQKRVQIFNKYFNRLKRKYKISINKKLLKKAK